MEKPKVETIDLRFGLSVSTRPEFYHLDFLKKAVLKAEELGFDSFLFPDHIFLPWANHLPEVWELVTFLAATTARIRLGTCVSPLTLKDPRFLARSIGTAAWIAPGRIIAGLGVGWNKREYDEFGAWLSYDQRLNKAKRALEIVQSLLLNNVVTTKSDYFDFKNIRLHLEAVSPPIWFGTKGISPSLLLASMCAGWIVPSWHVTPERYSIANSKVESSNAHFVRAILGGIVRRKTSSTRDNGLPERYFIGNMKDCAELVEAYAWSGCNYYICSSFFPREDFFSLAKEFAREIIPSWT